MALSINKKVWQYMLIVMSLLIICISFLFYIKPVFIAVVLGIFITIYIDKLIELYKKYTKNWTTIKKGAVVSFCLIAVVLLGSVVLVSAAASIKSNVEDLLNIYDDFVNRYEDISEDLIDSISDGDAAGNASIASNRADPAKNNTSAGPPPNIALSNFFKTTRIDIVSLALASSGSLIASVTDVISLITSTLFAAVIVVPLTALYYFKEKGKIKTKIMSLAPDEYKSAFEKTIQDVNHDIRTYTIVKILEAAVISFLYCVCFYIAGLPHWFAFGLLMGFFNIISYVGFAIPSIPVLVYAYSVGAEVMYAVAGIIIIIQLFDFFFILPNVIMKTIRVSPLTAVLLTLAGLKVFGFFGLIFALPIYLFCKIVLKACYKLLVMMFPDSKDLQEVADEA